MSKENVLIKNNNNIIHNNQMIVNDLAVIIVNYNSGSNIVNCVNSILTQTCLPSEIIIVDNASTDDSLDLIKRNFGNIVSIIENGSNVGFAKAVNMALKNINKKYVLLLNPDVILTKNYIMQLYEKFKDKHYWIGASGILLFPDRRTVYSAGGSYDPFTGFPWMNYWKKRYDEVKINTIYRVDYIPLAAALLQREVIVNKLSGLDDFFFLYGEDIDLALRALKFEYRCYVVPDAIAIHNIEYKKRKLALFRYYHQYKSNLINIIKNLPFCYVITSIITWSFLIFIFEIFFVKVPKYYHKIKLYVLLSELLSIKNLLKTKRQKKLKKILRPKPLQAIKAAILLWRLGGHSW